MARLILILFAILILVGGVLAATGVLHVQNNKDETNFTIDKKELKEKAHDAVQQTEEASGKALDKASQAMRNAADKIRGSAHSGPTNSAPSSPRLNDKNQPDGKDQPNDQNRRLPENRNEGT
jgi:hypothetical protein